MKNYYDVLGVKKNATQAAIKKQYQRLARKFHPDRSEEPNAKEQFQKVNTAYQTLKDPQKRAEYDVPEQREYTFRTGGESGRSLHDILREAMGDTSRFQFHQQQQQQMAQVNITLEEAFTGTTRTLNGNDFTIPAGVRSNNHLFVDGFIIIVNVTRHHKFQRAHDDLAIAVQISAIEAMLGIKCELKSIDNKIIKFSIPAGIQHGKVIRVAGKGMPNPEFNARGDLLVQVAITIPQKLTKDELDSIMSVTHRKTFDA